MAGEDKSYMAKEIVDKPDLLENYKGQYVIIMDQSLTYPKFDKLNLAICILAKKGWKAVNITVAPSAVGMAATMAYILMEKAPSVPSTV
jgi:hypothetical protein